MLCVLLGLHRRADDRRHFLLARPDVFQEHVLAGLVLADRLGVPVDVDLAGQGVGDDQRRRGQIVRSHLGMHAALEVAVAAEHGGDDQAVRGDLFGNRFRTAGRCCRCRSCSRSRPRLKWSFSSSFSKPASVRYSVTTLEPGARLVFTHGLTSRPLATALRANSPAATSTDGFEVFVQLVIAAITTEPSFSVPGGGAAVAVAAYGHRRPSASAGFFAAAFSFGSASWNDFFTSVSATRSCGREGPARLGTTVARSSSSESE